MLSLGVLEGDVEAGHPWDGSDPSIGWTTVHRLPPPEADRLPWLDDMAHRSFFFGPGEIASLRQRVPPHLRKSSTFEVLTAFLWKCRTVALSPDPDEEVRIICAVSARGKHWGQIPEGYYGNALAFPVAVCAAGKLCGNPLGYALELVKKTKGKVNEEYMKSVANLMVKAVYGCPAKGGVGTIPWVITFYNPFKNAKGDHGIVVPVCLPAPAMKRFVAEIDALVKETAAEEKTESTTSRYIMSAL